MPGRVKYHHGHKHPTILASQRKTRLLFSRMAAAASPEQAVDSSLFANTADIKGSALNKETITWLVVVCVIVITSIIIVSCLLCRCRIRRRKAARAQGKKYSIFEGKRHSHHPSLEVTDGRNEHWAWNRYAEKPATGTDLNGFTVTPLSKAAVKPAAAYPAEPVIVEEEMSEMSPPHSRARKGGSRYYSGLTGTWKRMSQIGRAY